MRQLVLMKYITYIPYFHRKHLGQKTFHREVKMFYFSTTYSAWKEKKYDKMILQNQKP